MYYGIIKKMVKISKTTCLDSVMMHLIKFPTLGSTWWTHITDILLKYITVEVVLDGPKICTNTCFSTSFFSTDECYHLSIIVMISMCIITLTAELSYGYCLTWPFNWTTVLAPLYMHRREIELLTNV